MSDSQRTQITQQFPTYLRNAPYERMRLYSKKVKEEKETYPSDSRISHWEELKKAKLNSNESLKFLLNSTSTFGFIEQGLLEGPEKPRLAGSLPSSSQYIPSGKRKPNTKKQDNFSPRKRSFRDMVGDNNWVSYTWRQLRDILGEFGNLLELLIQNLLEESLL